MQFYVYLATVRYRYSLHTDAYALRINFWPFCVIGYEPIVGYWVIQINKCDLDATQDLNYFYYK